uniref:Uncharacterized protein n=1 Tax=mine drainage metagenome TaxID=410659 RepID=E6QN82_9ZZZZ
MIGDVLAGQTAYSHLKFAADRACEWQFRLYPQLFFGSTLIYITGRRDFRPLIVKKPSSWRNVLRQSARADLQRRCERWSGKLCFCLPDK